MCGTDKTEYSQMKLTLMTRFCIVIAVFFIAFIAVSIFGSILNSVDAISERTRILTISAVQNIVVFILPAWVGARLESRQPMNKLSLTRCPRLQTIFGIIAIYVLALCALNQIVYWNDNMSLPSSMSEFEHTLRTWEDNSRALTGVLLSDSSVGGLISGILIIGCLTGLSEELFFRAGIQRMLSESMSRHAAIWVSALIFSAMHFQFFGFVPRLLLGAFFGYLYTWSGTIWSSAFAHILNNSIVVLSSWLMARGVDNADLEMAGVTETGFPIPACVSAVSTVIFIITCRSLFRSDKKLFKNKSYGKHNI